MYCGGSRDTRFCPLRDSRSKIFKSGLILSGQNKTFVSVEITVPLIRKVVINHEAIIKIYLVELIPIDVSVNYNSPLSMLKKSP